VTLEKTIKTLNEEVRKDDRPLDRRKKDYKEMRVIRNKLSHVGVKKGDDKFILDDKDKLIYFHKLTFLLEYSFLKNMGMSKNLLEKFYGKKKQLIQYSN